MLALILHGNQALLDLIEDRGSGSERKGFISFVTFDSRICYVFMFLLLSAIAGGGGGGGGGGGVPADH